MNKERKGGRPAKSRFDELGDRTKRYEAVETERRLTPGLPFMARLRSAVPGHR